MTRRTNSNEATRILDRLKSRRWNAKDAGRLLAIMDRNGETVTEFARRLGINDQRIRWWRDRLEARPVEEGPSNEEKEQSARFAPMIAAPPLHRGAWAVGYVAAIVISGEDLRIEIHDASAVAPTWLRDLANGLRAGGSR